MERIIPYIQKNIIKVIVGQRRVGKSCFLQQIASMYRNKFSEIPVVYINMEDIEFEEITNYKKLVEYAEKTKGDSEKAAIFVDEIQEIKEFEKALRHFQTKGVWDIYCTGSNAGLLSGELATLLTGRYIEIRMYGLSYSEFLKFHSMNETKLNFDKYIRYGGLPFLINLELEDNVVFQFLKNIYEAILFKDVIGRYQIRNVSFLQKLTQYISDNIGNIVSARKISEFLKSQQLSVSTNVVLDYLNYLSNAMLIYKVPRYDLKGKKVLEINEKYYFEDLGIRHAIVGYKHNDISQIIENIVFKHIIINQYEVYIGKLDDKEIDFVCTKNGKQMYIQVTLSLSEEQVRNREFGNLLAIDDNLRKLVITTDEYTSQDYKGVEILNIREFLLLRI